MGVWYRVLRGVEIRRRKPYCTRHTFTSVGLSNAVNINWLGKYCGTSVATIERHYGKYIKSDAAERLPKLAGTVTADKSKHVAVGQRIEIIEESDWWAHLDSNQGPTGYEPVALTN